MLTVTPPRTRRPRGGRPRALKSLTLVAATYQAGAWVRLTFDRPVDATGLAPAAVTVADQPAGALYRGTGAATAVSPQTVQIALQAFNMTSGTARLLNATAATGLVADDDGGQWAGATNVALPFP